LAYENVIVERDEGVGIITLNRPKVLNALSRELYRELDAAVTELEGDPDIAAIIFTGAGDRAFSAGADIHEMAREDGSLNASDRGSKRAEYTWHIARCSKPTIGAINGLAYGGGAMMAASFDIRVGCEDTSFRFLGASYGRVNSTWNLPMQVGWPIAKELLFTGRIVQAREAHRMGLLNHLVACDQLIPIASDNAIKTLDAV
jgi:enoyl-CoA hydratase/carnithine racemase